MSLVDAYLKAITWALEFDGQNVGSQIFTDLDEREKSGWAWCAAMVRDVLLHAGVKTPATWDGVRNMSPWAAQHHLLRAGVAGVQKGDILIWEVPGHEHVGIALGPAHGGTVESLAGNSLSHHHQMAVQHLTNWWTAHIPAHSLLSSHVINGAIGGGAATAVAATQHGGIAAAFHGAAVAHGAVLFLSAYLGFQAIKYLTETNNANVAQLEKLFDDPTLAERDSYLRAQLQLMRVGGVRRV